MLRAMSGTLRHPFEAEGAARLIHRLAGGVRKGALMCSLFARPTLRRNRTSVSAILRPAAATSTTGTPVLGIAK